MRAWVARVGHAANGEQVGREPQHIQDGVALGWGNNEDGEGGDHGGNRSKRAITDGGCGTGRLGDGSQAQRGGVRKGGKDGSQVGKDPNTFGVGLVAAQVRVAMGHHGMVGARVKAGNHTRDIVSALEVEEGRTTQQDNQRWTPGAVPVWGGRGAVSRHPRVHPARIFHPKLAGAPPLVAVRVVRRFGFRCSRLRAKAKAGHSKVLKSGRLNLSKVRGNRTDSGAEEAIKVTGL